MTQTTQRHALIAWLGDDHGLNNQQINELLTTAREINQRYPDPDDQPERDTALATAYRIVSDAEPDYVLGNLADDLSNARLAETKALAAIQQAAYQLVETGQMSENSFARAVGVDRMTVRKWLGKR